MNEITLDFRTELHRVLWTHHQRQKLKLRQPLLAWVGDMTGHGSGYSAAICKEMGWNPGVATRERTSLSPELRGKAIAENDGLCTRSERSESCGIPRGSARQWLQAAPVRKSTAPPQFRIRLGYSVGGLHRKPACDESSATSLYTADSPDTERDYPLVMEEMRAALDKALEAAL